MISPVSRKAILFGLLVVASFYMCDTTHAVGVLYGDPGWLHAYGGDQAYYHDPDGPNPDYINNSTNEPGGKNNWPALIDVRPCADNAACEAAAIWQNRNNDWEGSAPGDPLGGTPMPNPGVPPPAPGGVATYTDEGVSYLRIQDPGYPHPFVWGWGHKGDSDPGAGLHGKQEGNNNRIEFKHQMSRDAGFSGRQDILDFGVTVSFRARLATSAPERPLDMLYDEDGLGPFPWPADGVGYPVANTGRGMVMISQNGAAGPGRIAFSLLDNDAIADAGISTATTGLVMNNKSSPTNSPDTNVSTAATLNIVEIDNADLTDWHEFWITVQALPAPVAGNTHEVKIYTDGSLEPETFQVILGNQNESGFGSFLGMGLSSGSRYGAFDLDFIAYKEGVHAPEPPGGLDGDFNDDGIVDAADYVMWRKNNGTNNPLPNDGGLGTPIDAEHYGLWAANFGSTAGSGSASQSAVPEPSSFLVMGLAVIAASLARRRS
jgi:hypothetical protein